MIQPKGQTLHLISEKFKKAYRGNLQRKATSTLKCSMVMSSGRWQLLWVHTFVECLRYTWSHHWIFQRACLCEKPVQIFHRSFSEGHGRDPNQACSHLCNDLVGIFHFFELILHPFNFLAILLSRRIFAFLARSPPLRQESVSKTKTRDLRCNTVNLFERTDLRKDFLHARC